MFDSDIGYLLAYYNNQAR